MKKLIAVILVVCLAFAGLIGYIDHKNDQAAVPQESVEPVNTVSPEASQPSAVAEVKGLDYDALYASHDKDEIVMTVNGQDVTWADYFYMLFSQGQQVSNYFQSMALYYGIVQNWDDVMEEDGNVTYAQFVLDSAESALQQFAAIEGFAEENNVALTQQNLDDIEEQHQQMLVSACGEGATEEDFNAYLENIYMSRALYDRMNRLNYLYQQNFIQLYGENGERIGEEAAMKYLTDNQYISANHILLMTVDPTTGEALDEAAIAEKEAKAREIAEELQAITDPEQLMKRFSELKEEFCEDSGKAYYPDGYIFTPGTMVTEFEDSCNSLAEYQVSDPVQSPYGYHVILRLPLAVDKVMEYSDSGVPMDARSIAANIEYGQRLQDYMDSISVSYAEGFEKPELLQYLK